MNRERRFALRSVYFHSIYGDDPNWPAEFRPMPLDEAAKVLAQAAGPFDESRRRRAAARLMASGKAALTDPASPFREAVLMLFPAMDLHFSKNSGSFDKGGPFASVGTGVMLLEELEETLGPSQPQCLRSNPETSIEFDPDTKLISCESTIRVQRPLEALRRVLDPQNWDIVMSDYFRDACTVDCPGGNCTELADFSVPCDGNPPKPGSVWSSLFYEHYELDIGRMFNLVTFKNLLRIETEEFEGGYSFRYDLDRVLYGKIGLLQREHGGLDRDDGTATLRQRPDGWVELKATKFFRLEGWNLAGQNLDPLLNWWTSVTIGETLDSAYEAVCMDV